MVLRFFSFAVIFLFAACTELGERNNPDDPKSKNHSRIVPSSSSVPLSSSSGSSSNVPPPSSSSLSCTASNNDETYYCSNGVTKQYGSMADDKGTRYKTVEIGSKTWMAENLNFDKTGSKCGNDSNLSDKNTDTCDIYGRLYNWEMAKTVCPDGWHLPNRNDWETLVGGDATTAGTKLKAASGWNNNGNGTDNYGFSALPGGYGSNTNSFGSAGSLGYWWSNYDSALYILMKNSNEVVEYCYGDESLLLSVRCVKD